jgi:isopenicillin N synthase-like dioxygenase
MNRHSARVVSADDIPVIDVSGLADPNRATLEEVGEQMREAAARIGFFYVSGHGIAQSLIDEVDATARRFFAAPLADKLSIEPVGRHRGYIKQGEAKMYDRARPDLKESFIWGLDVGEDDPDFLAGNRMIGPNRWPAFMPELRPVLNRYLDEAHACAKRLLRALAVSLNAPDDTFIQRFEKPISRGSLVYYPPQPPELGDRQYGVEASGSPPPPSRARW